MKLPSKLVGPIAVLLLVACGEDNNNNDAGPRRDASAGDAGGDAGTDGGVTADAGIDVSCDPGTLATAGCGNSPIGVWTYRGACGPADIEQIRQLCAGVTVQATSHQVSGTLNITATDYTLDTTDVADITAQVPTSCSAPAGGCGAVQIAVSQVAAGATCTANAGGCLCQFTATLAAQENGTYTTAGGVLTTAPIGGGTPASYNYCVTGGALRYRTTTDSVVWVLSP